MDKPTTEMTKRELAEYLANKWYTGDTVDWATKSYMSHTKHQLLEQVEHARGERATSDLTYKYDH